MSVRDKWVRRFSIDETAKHKNGFTIYKITSVLFPLGSPEAVTVVSVWKRYSDVQQLHKSMKSLHAGLHLRGTFPALAKSSYFKRFHQEVIDERAKTIKHLLEFVAEHRLLFTSTDFVNFLQTGYPEPEDKPAGVINTIRSSLHLPIEETPPLEYQTSDDEARSPNVQITPDPTIPSTSNTQTDIDISQIPIYEAAEVEIRESSKTSQKLSNSNSFESINSIESLDSDLYDELSKVAVDKLTVTAVKRNVLPDLINFDVPSTSNLNNSNSDNVSFSSTYDSSSIYEDSGSRLSLYSKKSVLCLSNTNIDNKTRTDDSYVFEAGYLLNLAARCENMGDYQRAFECYKSGIEKMLIGVQTDTDQQRRALIKEKTNKYLSYAEAIYKNHLCNAEQSLLPEKDTSCRLHGIPLSMLKRNYEDLSQYRVLAVLGTTMMLVIDKGDQSCYAMKVIQKIPNNLTEFDDYFQQRNNETRQPILPTVIPYMVPLHAYIETNNLIFLILSYAPGEKLFDYIKKYAKSIPNTPARELNLENVFPEPKKKEIDIENDNIDVTDSSTDKQSNIDPKIDVSSKLDLTDNSRMTDDVNENEIKTDNLDLIDTSVSVNQLVINSQKLLLNVDKALTEVPRVSGFREENALKEERNEETRKEKITSNERCETPSHKILEDPVCVRQAVPGGAVRAWAAQLLTALHALHLYGVVCGDLNPKNILLSEHGQIILTYMIGYPSEVAVTKLRANRQAYKQTYMYIAPELHSFVYGEVDKSCDFWSYGAIMYQLICGFPLSRLHRAGFSRHTVLQLPAGLGVEETSLLNQLLTYEPSERLNAEDIKSHPYFKNTEWPLH